MVDSITCFYSPMRQAVMVMTSKRGSLSGCSRFRVQGEVTEVIS